MSLTDLHLGFRDEYQRRRAAALVMNNLADDRAQEECHCLMRFFQQLSTGVPEVSEQELAAAVRVEKLAAVKGLIQAIRTSPQAVDAWLTTTAAATRMILDRGHLRGWPESPEQDGPAMRRPEPPPLPAEDPAPAPDDEALARAETAYDVGETGAGHALGRVLELRGDLDRATTMFRLAAESGDRAALYALGRVYFAADVNDDRVNEVWHHAADLGHVEAMYGFAILEGPFGRRPGRYLRQAAVLGHPPAWYALGYTFHEEGDYDDAEAWWAQAARNGCELAAVSLEHLRADLLQQW